MDKTSKYITFIQWLERYTSNTSSNISIFQYKKPLSYISIDNQGTALVSWTTDSIPSIYYQLLSVEDGSFIGTEQKTVPLLRCKIHY